MSAQSTLENTLKEILRVVKPLREDWTTRLQIIDELRGAVESVESLRGDLCYNFMVPLFVVFYLCIHPILVLTRSAFYCS